MRSERLDFSWETSSRAGARPLDPSAQMTQAVRQSPLRSRRAHGLLRQFLEMILNSTVVFDDGLIFRVWTSDRERRRLLTGDLLHRDLRDLVEPWFFRWVERATARSLESKRPVHRRLEIDFADGPHLIALSVMSKASSADKAGFLVAQDMTEKRARIAALRKSEALLAQAEELAKVGSWEFDSNTKTLTWSAHFWKMLGLPKKRGPIPEDYGVPLIHPDDLERAKRDLVRAHITGEPFENELRFVTPDRGVRIFLGRGVPVRDESGAVVRIRGMSQDITEQREAEQALREREKLLSDAEEIANFGSYEHDCIARKTTLSPNLRKLYGIGPDDMWSPSDYWAHVHPEDRPRAEGIMQRAVKEAAPFDYIARFVTPAGSVRFQNVRGIPVFDADGRQVKRIGVVQDVTDQVRAADELRLLSQQLMRARDEEQRRLARELHESAGQTLAALKMTLGRLREVLPEGDTAARALLGSATALANEGVRELRTISYVMHPPMLDERGLGPALGWFVSGFAQRSGIDVLLDLPQDLPRHSPEIETTIFRIVQESLMNIHRYSGSRSARVLVARSNGDIVAEIRDAGCGILPESARVSREASKLGVGIAGMRERVQQLNGLFEISSAAGKGTVVRATLPVKSAACEASAKPAAEGGLHGT